MTHPQRARIRGGFQLRHRHIRQPAPRSGHPLAQLLLRPPTPPAQQTHIRRNHPTHRPNTIHRTLTSHQNPPHQTQARTLAATAHQAGHADHASPAPTPTTPEHSPDPPPPPADEHAAPPTPGQPPDTEDDHQPPTGPPSNDQHQHDTQHHQNPPTHPTSSPHNPPNKHTPTHHHGKTTPPHTPQKPAKQRHTPAPAPLPPGGVGGCVILGTQKHPLALWLAGAFDQLRD